MWVSLSLAPVLLCFQLLCAHAFIPRDGTANILLIITDDTGLDVFSGYHRTSGYKHSAYTPNLDELATNGVRFHNAWSHPMCSPARASIYTGRHAFRHGVTHPSLVPLSATEITIAELISDKYNSGYFGKWHLGYEAGSLPTDQGWDYFSGSLGNIESYFKWIKTQASPGEEPIHETSTQYATSVNTEEALTWIQTQHKEKQVWFAIVAYNAPHTPYHVPPSDLFSTIPLRGNVGDDCNDRSVDTPVDCYRAMMEAMDTLIGTLLERLPASETLVIVVGDNGTPGNVVVAQDGFPYAQNHAKTTVYEGGVNVPFIMRWTGTDSNVALDVVAKKLYALDIYATIGELAGFLMPEGVQIDSESLLDYVDSSRALPFGRDQLFTELKNGPGDIDRWALKKNGTDGNIYKYIYNEGNEECYNLSNNESELLNIWPTRTCRNAKASTPRNAFSKTYITLAQKKKDDLSHMVFTDKQAYSLQIANQIVSSFSLFGGLFMVFCWFKFADLRNFAFYLVFMLGICDIFNALGNMLGDPVTLIRSNISLCYFQVVTISFFGLGTIFWSSAIAFTLLMDFVQERKTFSPAYIGSMKNRYHTVCWIIPLVLTILPAFSGSYGDAGGLCWIKNDAGFPLVWRLITWYIPILGAMIFNVYVFGTVEKKLMNQNNAPPDVVRRLRLYPLVLILCCALDCLEGVLTAFGVKEDNMFILYFMALVCSSSQGIANALVYGMTPEVSKRLRIILYNNGSYETAKPLRHHELEKKEIKSINNEGQALIRNTRQEFDALNSQIL